MKELLKKYEEKDPEIVFHWNDPETEAEGNPLPEDETVLPAMLAYHDELARAGMAPFK